jgi:hypothetical protein
MLISIKNNNIIGHNLINNLRNKNVFNIFEFKILKFI